MYGGFPQVGVPCWGGPPNKDFNILGVYIEVPRIYGNCQVNSDKHAKPLVQET